MNSLVFLCGLPGSGKSHYANSYKERYPNTVIVSSDSIREELWGDANDQQNPKLVFDTMLERAVAALNEGYDVVYDATNLVAKTRKSTLEAMRKATNAQFHANLVFISCSISECKRRQADRERKVPDEVIDRMVRQFQAPWYNEGWDLMVVINRGKQQNIDREHWRMLGESHDNPHHKFSLEMHCSQCQAHMRAILAEDFELATSTREVLEEAAYQHDIGKHKTKAFLDSKGNPSEIAHFYSHDNVGAYLWLSGDKINAWADDDFFLIGALIQWHMQPYFMRDEDGIYHAKFKEWCNKRGFSSLFYQCICLLHEADGAAH